MIPRHLLATLFAGLTLVAGAPTAGAASLDETLADLFAGGTGSGGHPSAELLEDVGASYDGYLFAERLPAGDAYLVEASVTWQDRTFPFPVKLRRTDDRWTVAWLPERTYTKTLVSLLDSGELIALPADGADRWADRGHMPALPVLVSEHQVVTPFGAAPFADRDELTPSEPLGRHVGRWVNEVLENDPAPAGLAILARPSAPWDRLSRILLTAAGAGFFRVHLVARGDGELLVRPALAPVFQAGDQPSRANSLIVAMADETGTHFRLSVGDRLLDPPAGCEDVSLCLDGDREFGPALADRIETAFSDGPPDVSHVLFAAVGDTPLQAALERAVAVPGALGIPQRKLYLGHTQ